MRTTIILVTVMATASVCVFINGQCVHTTAGDPQPDGDVAGDGLTIGGSPVGAAN